MGKLPKGNTELSRDGRAISAVYPIGGSAGFVVGRDSVSRIEAYDENGEMSHVPWIAVFKGDAINYRVHASHVAIQYAESPAP